MSTDTQIIKKQWDLIPKSIKVFLSIPGMVYDCIAAILQGGCGAALGYFSQEEAYKYIDPTWLYHIKLTLVVSIAMIGAFQLFRSKSFAEHADRKKQAELAKP